MKINHEAHEEHEDFAFRGCQALSHNRNLAVVVHRL
jgi:hypothetical protein